MALIWVILEEWSTSRYFLKVEGFWRLRSEYVRGKDTGSFLAESAAARSEGWAALSCRERGLEESGHWY